MNPQEYDEYFRSKPNKWANEKRDHFIVANLICDLPSHPNSVLDIGCGNGHTLKMLSELWPDAKISGLDFSPVAIELAKINVPSASFICRSILEDVYPPKYDLVLCCGVLEHMPDLVYALEKIKRFMKRTSWLYLEVPHNLTYSINQEEGFRRLDNGSHQLEWHLRRTTWETIIQQAGLNPVRMIAGPLASYEFTWECRMVKA